MKVWEGQRLGALTILITSLCVYGLNLFSDRYPYSVSSLTWGDQESKRIAIEVTGSRGRDGIYFLPEATVATELSKITGHEEIMMNADVANMRYSSRSAISVSMGNGVLKVTDMSAAKKLALGLPIDLNRATEQELVLVPGIGEKMAAQIVQIREAKGYFGSLSDLTAIPGIKGKTVQHLEKYLTIAPMP